MADMNGLIRQGARRRYIAAEEAAQRARDERGRFTSSADGGARGAGEPESGSAWFNRVVLDRPPVRDGRFWTGGGEA